MRTSTRCSPSPATCSLISCAAAVWAGSSGEPACGVEAGAGACGAAVCTLEPELAGGWLSCGPTGLGNVWLTPAASGGGAPVSAAFRGCAESILSCLLPGVTVGREFFSFGGARSSDAGDWGFGGGAGGSVGNSVGAAEGDSCSGELSAGLRVAVNATFDGCSCEPSLEFDGGWGIDGDADRFCTAGCGGAAASAGDSLADSETGGGATASAPGGARAWANGAGVSVIAAKAFETRAGADGGLPADWRTAAGCCGGLRRAGCHSVTGSAAEAALGSGIGRSAAGAISDVADADVAIATPAAGSGTAKF